MSIFVKYGALKGNASTSKHKDWILCSQISFSTSRNITTKIGSTHNREVSAPDVGFVHLTKEQDSSSPGLWIESLTGKGEKCEIHCARTGDGMDVYFEVTLENSLIASYTVSVSDGVSMENIAISFTKMNQRFIPHGSDHKASGPLAMGYDLSTGKKV